YNAALDMSDAVRGFPEWRWPLPNVWLGCSVEDQPNADERIVHLLRCPAAVRFLSCEPMLGPVTVRDVVMGSGDSGDCLGGKVVRIWNDPPSTENWGRVHWVIAGGESGPGAR